MLPCGGERLGRCNEHSYGVQRRARAGRCWEACVPRVRARRKFYLTPQGFPMPSSTEVSRGGEAARAAVAAVSGRMGLRSPSVSYITYMYSVSPSKPNIQVNVARLWPSSKRPSCHR
ncbi:hypothetical protein PsYK624_077470 [Phanerochaete sordida]|uniref:Uncharacterized protein n=1 Tax=Phanerochaete sordida TaxID=48140 RepID=A0A9P3G987_9APHY|nr:hypothetical protein PsYK624_077470 [Phanerochaete sordida]